MEVNARLRLLSCEVVDKITTKLLKKLSTSEDEDDKYVRRSLPFIFVEDASLNDMIGVIVTDSSEVVCFCKEVNQSSGKKQIRCAYSVSKKFLHFVHYETKTIIQNSISELSELEPKLVSEVCNFYLNDEEVELNTITNFDVITIKIDGVTIPNKISSILLESDSFKNILGYYIC